MVKLIKEVFVFVGLSLISLGIVALFWQVLLAVSF